MNVPPLKIEHCECCMQKGESRELVGRTIRSRTGPPIHFRLCKACAFTNEKDFYINLTRKLMGRILKKQREERALSIFKYRFFGFE